jgi:2-isopropylmalate synthase
LYPYSPEIFNRKARNLGGKKSGKAFVKNLLEQKGQTASEEQIQEILLKIKETGEILKNTLSDEDIDIILKEVIG